MELRFPKRIWNSLLAYRTDISVEKFVIQILEFYIDLLENGLLEEVEKVRLAKRLNKKSPNIRVKYNRKSGR